MQAQLLNDDNCACFLVEAIAKRSQDIIWKTKVDGQNVSHKRIRRLSIDKFYEAVTGESDAFFQICMGLPEVVDEVIREGEVLTTPTDSVYTEIKNMAQGFEGMEQDLSMILSMYMLGFRSYNKFQTLAEKNKNMKQSI